MDRSSFIGDVGRMLGGLLAWSLHFGAIYAYAALVCAGRIGASGPFGLPSVPLFTVLATIGGAGAIGWLMLGALRHRAAAEGEVDRFMAALTLLTGALALLAILWNALPAFTVPACGAGA